MKRNLVTEYDLNVVERIITEIDDTYKKHINSIEKDIFIFHVI